MSDLGNIASPSTSGGGLTDAELRATPVPVSGTVAVTEPISIDDNGASLTVDGSVAVSNFPATQPVSGPLTDTQLRLTPVPVSGTVSVSEPVSIDDNGGSLTVDGTFWQATQPVSIAAAVPVTDNAGSLTVDGTVTAAAQPGVDIGDVTINNASGAAAVNIQDGGNSITVDGTFYQATQPVSIASAITANPATANGKTLTFVSVAQGAAGTTVLAAASASNKHKVLGVILVMDAAGTLKFTDGVGDLTGAMSLAANAGFVLPTCNIQYMETGAVNRAINLVTTTGKASGVVILLTEP